MSIVAVLLIWYFAVGRNKPDTFRKVSSKLPMIIGIMIFLSVFGWVPLMLLPLLFLSAPLLMVVGFAYAIYKIGAKKTVKATYDERVKFNIADSKFTKAVPKRRRIVSKFNDKYELRLTTDQIQTIVDASYVSPMWEAEIIAMDKSYNTVFEWFNSDTAWLRAYLHAFNVQEVSSDFMAQKEIVLRAFREIFSSMNFQMYSNKNDLLWDLNNKFLTRFDDVTFMIAYRFLEANGYEYDVRMGGVVRNEDEAERLSRKYQI